MEDHGFSYHSYIAAISCALLFPRGYEAVPDTRSRSRIGSCKTDTFLCKTYLSVRQDDLYNMSEDVCLHSGKGQKANIKNS